MYNFSFNGADTNKFFKFVQRNKKGKKYIFGVIPNDDEIEEYSKFLKKVKNFGITLKFTVFPIDFNDPEFFECKNISSSMIEFSFPDEEEAFYFKLKYSE